MRQALLLLLLTGISQARVTSPFPSSADLWCNGASGVELCQDASGNWVPTTTGVNNLGSTALKWQNLYLTGLINSPLLQATTLQALNSTGLYLTDSSGVQGLILQNGGNLLVGTGKSLTLAGSGGYVTLTSSVNASAFFGSGARLTGITDANVNLTTAAIISGKFGDSRISISSAATNFADQSVKTTSNVTFVGITNTSTSTVLGNAFSVGGSTLVVKNGLVGIGTTNPGSLFTVSNGTFSVTSAGSISGPSQPSISISRINSDQGFTSATFQDMYWDTKNFSNNITFDAVNSSATVTIQTAGIYFVSCNIHWGTQATGTRFLSQVLINATPTMQSEVPGVTGCFPETISTGILSLSAGDALKCQGYQNAASGQQTLCGTSCHFDVIKLW